MNQPEINVQAGSSINSQYVTPPGVLGPRALNRALLARQHLLQRSTMPPLDMLEHLAGMQAQAQNPPYFGLWTRLESFRHEALSSLILDRQAVRIVLMRGTIHLVSARDSLKLRPHTQPMLDRWLKGLMNKPLLGLDTAAVALAARSLVEERSRSYQELGLLLQQKWPDYAAEDLARAARALVPLVQVPPRGIWGAGGQALHTSLEAWLGSALDDDAPLDETILRYLGAFGPATVKDAQVWSGLTKLRDVFERLRPRLAVFRDEAGNELFDLPDAPRPDPDSPAPVRFLSEFDNMLLSYADRSRILAEPYRRLLFTVNGIIRAAVLVDGFVRGMWTIERRQSEATLTVQLFEPVLDRDRSALEEEGARLLAFADADADHHSIRIEAGK
ncbi:winged helix DNA-binding domain-containing protein [Paenibacillus filicis]|uniref:Winged helix DNA-binding domain-containing protein n=1 Tax=Paenibacillus filicis TaxID=669464 RepID=A0ABU9DG94_9BACL